MTTLSARLIFREVTWSRWADLERLFESPRGPKYCWCMAWRPMPPGARTGNGGRRFVSRRLRGKGLMTPLIKAAVAQVRRRGATVVEAYPVDPDSPATVSWGSHRPSKPPALARWDAPALDGT